jgi:hypothetical protein
MSKFKIEHGASKVQLVQLKTNIEDGISSDIDLMCEWSNNERRYIVNELLRFAITQEEDFLKHKAGLATGPAGPAGEPKSVSAPVKLGPNPSAKTQPSDSSRA